MRIRKIMEACAVLLGLLVCATPLAAQTVQQSGSVTPGHPVRWVTTGVVADGGSPTNGSLTGVGVTASGPSICANSGPLTGALNRICLGATQTGGGVLSLDNINGGTGGFTFRINGVTQGIATVTLPVTIGDAACFADTTGTLQDCGGAPVFVTCIAAGSFPIWTGATWTCSTASNSVAVLGSNPTSYAALNVAGTDSDPSITYNGSVLLALNGSTTNSALVFGISGTTPFPAWIQARNKASDQAGTLFINSAGGGVAINVTPSGLGTGLISGMQIGDNWAAALPTPGGAAVINGGVTVYGDPGGFASFTRSLNAASSAISVSSYAYADNAALRGAWSFYGECHVLTAADNCSGIEISGVNRVGVVSQFDPFSASARVGVLGIDCGNSIPAATYASYNCDFAINIVQNAGAGNTNTYTTGISFQNGSLDVSGGVGRAISMVDGYVLSWYSAANTVSAQLNATTASGFILTKGSSTNVFIANSGASGIEFPQYGAGLLQTSSLGVVSALTGVSGGIPYFNGTAVAYSAALTANLPVIGGGAGSAPTVGTRSGNTTAFVTTTGTQTSGNCVSIDASGNHIASGAACQTGTVTSIATTSPITGGTITTTGTIACATCVTSAAALTVNSLVIGGGLQATSVTTTGTGVLTALGINVGSAGAFVTFNGALGTPSSGTLSNATGLPISTGVSGLGTGVATFLATPSSANLAAALTDETGTAGSVVFSVSPTFTGTTVLATARTTGTLSVGGASAGNTFEVHATTFPTLYAIEDSSGMQGGILQSGTETRMGNFVNSVPLTLWAGAAERARLSAAGGLSVGDTTDPGAGGLRATGATIQFTALANAATTSAVCYNTGTGLLTYNATVGTCTVSTLAAKTLHAVLSPKEGFDMVMGLEPWKYELKADRPTYLPGEQIGFIAEYANDERLVARNPDGSAAGFRYEQYTAALTAAIKYLKADNDNLRADIERLKQRVNAR